MSSRKNVTQYDVAKEAGVTRSMVSYVISGNSDRSVAPETRKKILAAIERLGYHPNKAARTLQQGAVGMASKRIGVVLRSPDIFRRPYYAEILEGIHIAAHERKHQIDFIRFFEELKDSVLFNELIHEEEIGGLILLSIGECIREAGGDEILEKMRQRIKKIVCVGWKSDGLSSVMFDRSAAAEADAEFLFSEGYENIAYIGQQDERVAGIHKACRHHQQDDSNVIIGTAFTMEGGYKAMEKIHRENALPRALVCGSDEVAIGALCYLNEHRIAVPQEVALISIDNIEDSAYTMPPLTTMNVQKSGMGRKAVEMIVDGFAGQGAEATNILLPVQIVHRSSC